MLARCQRLSPIFLTSTSLGARSLRRLAVSASCCGRGKRAAVCAAGVSNDEFEREGILLAADRFLVHESNGSLGKELAMFVGVGANGGERRTGKGRGGHVIISDNSNIVRDGESSLPDSEHGADCHRIIAGKECRGTRMLGENVLHGLVTAGKAKVRLGNERLLVGKACGIESGAIALADAAKQRHSRVRRG